MKHLLGLLIIMAAATTSASASSEADFWRDVINTCAPSALVTNDAVYISASNQIGPGAVWRKGSHNHYMNVLRLQDIATGDVAKDIVNIGKPVSCSAGEVKKGWNLKVSLPFSIPATSDSFDINLQLSRADSATITINKYSIDVITYAVWEQAFTKFPSTSAQFQDATDGNGLLAENAVSIPSMTITYSFSHSLTAEVVAKLQNRHISLGDGAGIDLTVGASGTQIVATISQPAYVLVEFGKIGKVAVAKTTAQTTPTHLPYKAHTADFR